ncbi:DUF5819 family protein [Streptomyces sp. NPDC007346]|uniref:DUF5819 family protein n=1 Tax=Streptomyces sp. NPDC007346 TaxID=3154682 RepID=UPI00345666C3
MDADHGGSSGSGDSGSVHEDVRPQAVSHAHPGQDTRTPALNAPASGPNDPAPAGPNDPAPAGPEAPPPVQGPPGAGVGIGGLSFGYQVVAALALSLIGLLACAQVAMVFLHVAPSNTLTKQHGKTVDDWIYPEFEQNWKLFAPNPLQQNIHVHVRAEVAGADGRRTTGWINLSREDGDAIRGNLFPSHVNQNELRRGWDFFVNSHDDQNRPNGLRGDLSERYIRRIAMLRLSERDLGGTVERIQIRSATSLVAPPSWSTEKANTRPSYRVLSWWTVTPDDLPAPRDAARGEEGDK